MRRKQPFRNLLTDSTRISPLRPLKPYTRCACGICPECKSNAHWDRVFAKFEVNEQGSRGVSRSPLADL
jgi:hypothetical protein